jgi:hypothetical protein
VVIQGSAEAMNALTVSITILARTNKESPFLEGSAWVIGNILRFPNFIATWYLKKERQFILDISIF